MLKPTLHLVSKASQKDFIQKTREPNVGSLIYR